MAELPEPPTPTLSAIYASYEARQGDGFRDHLGASLIGKSCARALWYDFRWATPARHTGRILRLFETGQLEEARLVRDLRATGATVLEVDPETGRQFRVEAHGGHFGGSLDAVALGLLEAPKTWHVVEFKTHWADSRASLTIKIALLLAMRTHPVYPLVVPDPGSLVVTFASVAVCRILGVQFFPQFRVSGHVELRKAFLLHHFADLSSRVAALIHFFQQHSVDFPTLFGVSLHEFNSHIRA
ncbi:MAG: hypothetical protein KatS3mg118_3355 [Paracoccaceae bacterium]|nr:MAG: hypothetical protein KatS3mg118_3355 [Paracoccaceae bacterium]